MIPMEDVFDTASVNSSAASYQLDNQRPSDGPYSQTPPQIPQWLLELQRDTVASIATMASIVTDRP